MIKNKRVHIDKRDWVRSLWFQYWKTKSALNKNPKSKKIQAQLLEIRNKLVESYIPYANSVTSVVRKRKNIYLSFEELASFAYESLIQIIDKYKPEKGCFVTYAGIRIKGSILNGIRSGHGGRTFERCNAARSKIQNKYLQTLERNPTQDEIEAEMNLAPQLKSSVRTLNKLRGCKCLSEYVNLSGIHSDQEFGVDIDYRELSPFEEACYNESLDILRTKLSPRLMAMLNMKMSGFLLKEIGEVNGITKSGVHLLFKEIKNVASAVVVSADL